MELDMLNKHNNTLKKKLDEKTRLLELAHSQLTIKNARITNIRSVVVKLADSLKGYEIQMKESRKRFVELEHVASELRLELKGIKENSAKNEETVAFLKQTIERLNDKKAHTMHTERCMVTKVTYLNKQVDLLSGSLSEEKLRSAALEKFIKSATVEYNKQLTQRMDMLFELLTKVMDPTEGGLVAKLAELKHHVLGYLDEKTAPMASLACTSDILELIKKVECHGGVIAKAAMDSSSDLSETKLELRERKREVVKLQKTISDLTKKLDYFKEQDLINAKHIFGYKKELEALTVKMDTTILDLAAEKSKTVQKLENKIEELHGVIETANNTNDEEVLKLTEEKSLLEKCSDDYKVEISSLKAKVAELDMELAKENMLVKSKDAELSLTRSEIAKIGRNYDARVEELNSTKHSLTQAKKETEKSRVYAESLSDENCALQKLIKGYKTKIQRVEQSLKDIQQTNNFLQNSLDDSTNDLSKATDKNCEADEYISRLTQLVEDLKTQIKEKATHNQPKNTRKTASKSQPKHKPKQRLTINRKRSLLEIDGKELKMLTQTKKQKTVQGPANTAELYFDIPDLFNELDTSPS